VSVLGVVRGELAGGKVYGGAAVVGAAPAERRKVLLGPVYLVTYIRANVGMPRTLSFSMPPTLEPWIIAVPE